MDTQKLQEKNLERARNLVAQIQAAAGRNQMALRRNREEYEALIKEGKELAGQLAEASEYLLDLEEAARD